MTSRLDRDKATTTIETFARRARRVEVHTLLRDKDQFIAWAHGTGRVTMHADGSRTLEHVVPDEELFESLAARCRPFLLKSERIHYVRVLAALDLLLGDDEDSKPGLKAVRECWERAMQEGALAFLVRKGPIGGELSDPIADAAAAHAWLYSDLVHADPHRDPLDIEDRYVAAVIVYGQAVISTLATLNVIRGARDRGVLCLSDEPFEVPVSVRVPIRYDLARMATAPVGTPVEALEAVLDGLEAGESSA